MMTLRAVFGGLVVLFAAVGLVVTATGQLPSHVHSAAGYFPPASCAEVDNGSERAGAAAIPAEPLKRDAVAIRAPRLVQPDRDHPSAVDNPSWAKQASEHSNRRGVATESARGGIPHDDSPEIVLGVTLGKTARAYRLSPLSREGEVVLQDRWRDGRTLTVNYSAALDQIVVWTENSSGQRRSQQFDVVTWNKWLRRHPGSEFVERYRDADLPIAPASSG